jgi:catechol 2,3-dioxygenase-like lactoylglutathione lyase family enzyme
MFSHLCIGVNDFDRAFTFYSAIAKVLDLELKFSDSERAWAGWQRPAIPRPLLVIGKPLDGQIATAGNGQMVALLADNRTQIEHVYQAALKHGATCEGPPGLRPHYHEHYFGAYFRDPDGNKLCVCCHQPDADS